MSAESDLGTVTTLLSEVFQVAAKNFGAIAQILSKEPLNLTLSHPQEESTDDRKRKTRTTPYFHEVWDLEEIEAFENARKKHGDDFDSLCKAVSSRKRSEIRKLWNQYKKAYPLDAKGNPIEFDESSDEEENESLNIPHISESASEDEEAEEEEVEEEEESEEEPQPPPKKTKRPKPKKEHKKVETVKETKKGKRH